MAQVLDSAIQAAAAYAIDTTHSTVDFKVRHMMVANVRGEFSGVTGTVKFDPANPENSSITASIDASTINTRDARRDEHLKSADFLDVQNFPTLDFVSRTFAPNGGGRWKVAGDLTIRGVTKGVVLDVEGPTAETRDPWGGTRVGASATARINRKDFGLAWNVALEAGGVLVGDEVTITLEIELTRL